jgi:hypothetical protein
MCYSGYVVAMWKAVVTHLGVINAVRSRATGDILVAEIPSAVGPLWR